MTELQKRLLRACAELSLKIECDPEITLPSGGWLKPLALIPQLGANRGMVIVSKWDELRTLRDELVEAGYGYSVLSEPTGPSGYLLESCIEMFSDWGWSDHTQPRPGWLVDPPDDDSSE